LAGVDYSKCSVYIPNECQNLLLISFKWGYQLQGFPYTNKIPILEGSLLTALWELELGESVDRIS